MYDTLINNEKGLSCVWEKHSCRSFNDPQFAETQYKHLKK